MTLRRSALTTALTATLSIALLAGCNSSKSGAPSTPAPSPTDIGGSISSGISKAQSLATSALSEIGGGVQATDDVTAGPVTLDPDGHATTDLTIKNNTDQNHDYTISIFFNDSGGSLQDVVVVNAQKVPAHGQSQASAKSNRKLSGTLTAKVSAAVRH